MAEGDRHTPVAGASSGIGRALAERLDARAPAGRRRRGASRLHHVGYVVADIDAAAAAYPGLTPAGRIHDPLQEAELAIYAAGGSFLEFIRPTSEQAFTWRHLQAGGGYHHLCWAVAELAEAEAAMRAHRLMKIRGPMPALLFGGKDVLFALTRQKGVIEFLIDPDFVRSTV